MKKIRHLIFLKDVLVLSLTSFGGPTAHVALFFKILVQKRAYLSEAELLELNSFCQILPGPASTQTLTAVGFKIGGPRLAFLTLLVWILPAAAFMTFAAILVGSVLSGDINLTFLQYMEPIALGFILYAVYKTINIINKTLISYVIVAISAVLCFFIKTPWMFPIILLVAGSFTSLNFGKHPKQEKTSFQIRYANLILYVAIFVGAALLGLILDSKPIRLFENFFRNGSLIFGGGQALIGYFYIEFVQFKKLLTSDEFLTGYAMLQSLPGPVFTFASYIGSLSLREYGLMGQILGGIIGSLGVFLPGTILIFFIAPIWQHIKQYRVVKASFEGINAGNAGIIIATALNIFWPMLSLPSSDLMIQIAIVFITAGVLIFTKIPHPILVLLGGLAGFLMAM
ncbi:MAG: chromate efflux transporter [Cytophagaceae bacterium]